MKKIRLMAAAFVMLSAVSCSSAVSHVSENGSVSTVEESDAENNADEHVTVTVGMVYELTNVYEYVEKFNAARDDITVEIKRYIGDFDPLTGYDPTARTMADLEINRDIIKGGIVDMVCDGSFNDRGYYDILENQGAFADLYDIMAADGYDKTALNSHVLSLFENGGKLLRMPCYYTFNTLAGNEKFVGDGEGQTADELIAAFENAPENATFNGSDDDMRVFFVLLRNQIGRFIDYEKGEAYFDCPDFVRLLDFCRRFRTNREYKNADPTAPMFAAPLTVMSLEGYHLRLWELRNIYGFSDVTFMGYPSEDGGGAYIESMGAFSICRASDAGKQAAAWEFLKYMISEECQSAALEKWEDMGLPINNNVFGDMAQSAMSGGENVLSFNGDRRDIGRLTAEEYDKLVTMINGTTRAESTVYSDLYAIIEDEVLACFNGERTAEEAAALIQNRAAIMVSEKT